MAWLGNKIHHNSRGGKRTFSYYLPSVTSSKVQKMQEPKLALRSRWYVLLDINLKGTKVKLTIDKLNFFEIIN